MKKLIALVVIAAGVLAANSLEVAVGAGFEAPEDLAAKLIADGLAKEEEAAAEKVKTVPVRVLTVGAYGEPNDVIDLPANQLKQAKADGLVDDEKSAVAYARSLKKSAK